MRASEREWTKACVIFGGYIFLPAVGLNTAAASESEAFESVELGGWPCNRLGSELEYCRCRREEGTIRSREARERERERGLEPHSVWLCGCVLAGLYLPKRPLKRFLKTRSGFFSSPYYSPVVTLAASVSINSSTWIAIVNRVCALLPSFTWAPLRLVRAVLFKTFKFGTWLQQLSVDSVVVSFSKSGNWETALRSRFNLFIILLYWTDSNLTFFSVSFLSKIFSFLLFFAIENKIFAKFDTRPSENMKRERKKRAHSCLYTTQFVKDSNNNKSTEQETAMYCNSRYIRRGGACRVSNFRFRFRRQFWCSLRTQPDAKQQNEICMDRYDVLRRTDYY